MIFGLQLQPKKSLHEHGRGELKEESWEVMIEKVKGVILLETFSTRHFQALLSADFQLYTPPVAYGLDSAIW